MHITEHLKQRVYAVLVDTDDGALIDRIVAVFLMILIVINAAAVIAESDAGVATQFASVFHALELFSIAVFTVEYLLRLWVAPLDPRYRGAFAGRARYMRTPLAVIDLLALVPFYAPILVPLDLRVIRILRVFRLFRLFKLARYAESLTTLGAVLRGKKEELLVTTLMLGVLLVCASTLLHVVEGGAQPDKFGSIPLAMWWGVATLTTVGYGDVFPVTPLGRFCGAVVAILGIGMFALPTGIFATGFAEELTRRKVEREMRRKPHTPVRQTCPHCGELIVEAVTAHTGD